VSGLYHFFKEEFKASTLNSTIALIIDTRDRGKESWYGCFALTRTFRFVCELAEERVDGRSAETECGHIIKRTVTCSRNEIVATTGPSLLY